jgi:hypothetical protein
VAFVAVLARAGSQRVRFGRKSRTDYGFGKWPSVLASLVSQRVSDVGLGAFNRSDAPSAPPRMTTELGCFFFHEVEVDLRCEP